MQIPYNNDARPDTGLYNAKLGIWLFLASEVMLFGALFSSYVLLRAGSAQSWQHMGMHILNIPLATLNTILLISSSVTMVLSWASLIKKQLGRYRLWMGITILFGLGFLVVKSFEYGPKFRHYQVHMADGTSVSGHIEKLETDKGEATIPFFARFERRGQDLFLGKGKGSQKIKMIHFVPDAAHGEGAAHPAALEIKPRGNVVRMTSFGPGHSSFIDIYFIMTGLHVLHVIGGLLVNLYNLGPGARMWSSDPVRFTNRIECAGLYWHFVDLVWIFLFPTLYLL